MGSRRSASTLHSYHSGRRARSVRSLGAYVRVRALGWGGGGCQGGGTRMHARAHAGTHATPAQVGERLGGLDTRRRAHSGDAAPAECVWK